MSEGMPDENGPHFRGPFMDEFHLAICIPSPPWWDTGFAISLLNAVQALNNVKIGRRQSYQVKNVQAAILTWSREKMVLDSLLEQDPRITHILFLDCDMVFPPDTIHWMAFHQKPIVIANYTRRQVPAVPVTKDLNNQILPTTPQDSGLQPVRYGGLGVGLFERRVFSQVPRPWFDLRWREDGPTPGSLNMDSEDTLLFDNCRAAGFEVLVDHDLSQHVAHIGRFEYTNNMADPRDWLSQEVANG